MKRFYGRVAPVCGRSGGKAVRLSEPKVGPLYKVRDLGRLFGKENVLTMWHRGYLTEEGKVKGDEVMSAEDEDNMVTVSVKYFSEAERADYLVTIGEDGKLRQRGELFDTTEAKPQFNGRLPGMYIFAMDEFGRIYAADNQKEALARGLGEYYEASDQRIYDAVTTGVPIRKWILRRAPVDHYKTIFLDEDVPCDMATPGGQVGDQAPAEEDPSWLASLRRSPYSTTAVSTAIISHARETSSSSSSSSSDTVSSSSASDGATGLFGSSTYTPYKSKGSSKKKQVSSSSTSSTTTSSSEVEPLEEKPELRVGPQKPMKWQRGEAKGWACLGTVKPGQGIYVVTVPRTQDGALDVAKLEGLAEAWEKLQDQYAQEWQRREDELKKQHDERQERKKKKHEEAQQDLPEQDRTPYEPEEFTPVPFARQPYPGDPSEAPPKGGWVCRNCYERRRRWPIMQMLKLPKEKVDPVYEDAKQNHQPQARRLLWKLKNKGVIDDKQFDALIPYGEAKAPKKIELFHHSSFLAGAPVAAAGELKVEKGVVELLSNESGHYLPPAEYLLQVAKEFIRRGADAWSANVHLAGENNENYFRRLFNAYEKGEISPSVLQAAKDLKDARENANAHGSQGDLLSELRMHLERGVQLRRTKAPARLQAPDAPILCDGEVEEGKRCPATSATVDFMDYVEGAGWLCQACLDRSKQTTQVE